VSLKGFSQVDTTKIVLSSKVAREVVKDLVRYDNLKTINKLQDSIIKYKDSEIIVLKDLNTLSDNIISNQTDIINKLSKNRLKLDIRIGSNITNRFQLYNTVRLNYSRFYIGSFISVNNYLNYLSYDYGVNLEYKIF
jgi:hypothetical protein